MSDKQRGVNVALYVNPAISVGDFFKAVDDGLIPYAVVESLLGALAEERSVWDTKSGTPDVWAEYEAAWNEYERLKAAVASARVRVQELGWLARQEQEERKQRTRGQEGVDEDG